MDLTRVTHASSDTGNRHHQRLFDARIRFVTASFLST
jgi:hypothetical protein